MNVSHYLLLNSDTYSDKTYNGTTDASTKHTIFNDELILFYETIVLLLQKVHFCSNVIKFVLSIIPKFDNIISETKDKQMDETPSSLRW